MPTKKSYLLLFFLIVFLDLLGGSIAIPVVAVLFLDRGGILTSLAPMGIRTIMLGLLIATYPLAQFFGAPLLGALSDRYGRKKILLISLIGTLFGYVLFAVGIKMHVLWMLFAGRIIDGLTGGNISIVLSSIADISEEKEKTKNFGLIGMAFGLGFIFGPYLGGELSDPTVLSWFTFATPFWFAAILSLVNIILVIAIFKETLVQRIHASLSIWTGMRNMKKALQYAHLRTIFVVVFLLALGFNFFMQFFQVYLITKFTFNQSQIGTLFGYIGLWIAIAQGMVARPLSTRFKPAKILSFSALLLGLTLPFLLIPAKASLIFIIIPFIAIFQGLTYPSSTAVVSNLSSKDSQGEILGINQSIQSLAQAIPPIIAGFIVTLHHTLPIFVAAVCTLIAWLIFLRFYHLQKETLFKEV